MRIALLFAAYAGIVLALDNESTDNGNVVNRGTFPYMAFLYYPDDSVVDEKGVRITKSAVLIQENWLISSSFVDANTSNDFPKKTLLARLGAISIDNNFTLNEDENEQEREIIQIARPYNFNTTLWWYSDISLLKTLLPFVTTPTVSVVPTISKNSDLFEMSCYVLLYVRIANTTAERTLMKSTVDLLEASLDKCGSNFKNDTMFCAAPSDEKSAIFNDSNFCEGNRGGPLLCDNELTGIQTYINDCQQPYLYQRLSAWENLLSCAVQEKCLEEQCSTICFLINKDTTTLMAVTTDKDNDVMFDNEFKNNASTTNTDTSIIPTLTTTITTVTTTTTEATTVKDTTLSTTIVTKSKRPAGKKATLTHKTPRIVEYTASVTTEIVDTDNEDIAVRKTVVQAQNHKLHSKASFKIFNLIPYFTSVTLIIMYFT
ncbi:unnamed protein product, partial [Brenthis ino]